MKTGIPWYKRVDDIIKHMEHIIIGSGMIFISAIVMINTILRYFFNSSWTWAEEIARYVVVWICFVGCASCVRFGSHVIVDVFIQNLKGKARIIYDIVMGILCSGFAVFLAKMGFASLTSSAKLGNVSAMTGIPIWTIFLGVALGLSLISYGYIKSTVINILNFIKSEKNKKQASGSGEAQI
ncbi:MAG: TRAP transporter small permease [Spirochaetaceae bacterium]|nr:TRAP transporter small permease [Spirochaetaceae bacterium]